MLTTPDFYNPIFYSVLKQDWIIRKFRGQENVQVNYSQLHQDMFLLAILDGKVNGTFIDIGANEPIFINNTYLLEASFDWTGFSVEWDSNLALKHKKLRKNACFCLDATKADYKELVKQAGLSDVIDYLSVDTEPPETTLAALKQLPHSEYKFRVITFEHDYSAGGVAVRTASRAYLSALGYQMVVGDISWGNRVVEDWWIHPDLTDKAIVEQMSCLDEGAHEHDKYIYGAYKKTPQ